MPSNESNYAPKQNNNRIKADTVSTLSNIGKSISLTAHALVSIPDINDTIFSSKGPYNKVMSTTLKNSRDKGLYPAQINIVKDNDQQQQGIVQPSNQYFKNNFINERKTFQLLSHINDSLLYDINYSNTKVNNNNGRTLITGGDPTSSETSENKIPSLYQGFQTLTLSNENNPDTKLLDDDNNLSQDTLNDSTLIEKSYSIPFLKQLELKMIQQLNNYEIRKNITISDIENIDSKIKKLKFRRNLLFNSIASIEEKELTIESDLSLVKDRILSLSDINDQSYHENDTSLLPNNNVNGNTSYDEYIDNSTSNNKTEIISKDLKKTTTRISTISNDFNNGTSTVDMDTISDLIDYKDTNSSRNLNKFFQERNKKIIKIAPTLHQYFDPGSEISSFNTIHTTPISAFQFDLPFGHFCSSSFDNPEIKIWDLSKDTQISNLLGHDDTVCCMEIDKSYNMLISGSKDSTIKMWDLNKSIHTFNNSSFSDSSSCIYSFNEHMDTVTNVSINSDRMVSGSQDSTIRQWDLHSGKCIQILDLMSIDTINLFDPSSKSAQTVNNIEVPKIGGLQSFDVALATGTNDGIVRLWDLRSGEIVRSLAGHSSAISCLKFDLQNIITGSLDQTVRTWDLRMGSSVNLLEFDAPILSLDFDSKNIVIADGSPQVQVYDRLNDKQRKCGADDDSLENITIVQYTDNYLVGSRLDGSVHTWAV